MRIFNKILKILFVLIFIVSVCFNVVLGLSSDYSLVFKDSEEKRRQLSNRAFLQIFNSDKLTFENKYIDNTKEESQKIRAIVSCSINKESTTNSIDCKQITYTYNLSDELITTTYFPNATDKYVVAKDSDKPTKRNSDYEVLKYVSSLRAGAFNSLSCMMNECVDSSTNTKIESSNFKTKLNFNFNKFSLTRNVTFNNGASTTSLVFDNDDKLVSLKIGDNELSIKYDTTNLQFPSFDSYVEE